MPRKPKIEVEITAEVKKALAGLKQATAALTEFREAAGTAGGKITVSLGRAAKQAGIAAREIKTEFSDSFREVDAAIKASGVTAGNWSTQIVRDVNAVTPPVIKAKTVFDGLHQSLQHLPRAANGFGVITNQTKLLTTNLQRVALAGAQASRSLVGVGREGVAGIRGGTSAAISFGHIMQDLPYGINGIANNITQLTTQMGYMAASAKAAGVSMKAALLASITNPAVRAVLAVSAVTTAMVYFTGKVGKTKKETKELKDETEAYISSLNHLETAQLKGAINADQETNKLRILWTVINDVSTSTEDRARAVQELQKLFPDYFGKLTQEQILTSQGAKAYADLTKNIIAASNARAAQKELDTATEDVRNNERFLKGEQQRLDAIDKRATAEQTAIDLATESARKGSELAITEIAARETRLSDILKERQELESVILNTKLKNIQLTGQQRKLEEEIFSGIEEGGVAPFLGDFGDAEKEIKKQTDTLANQLTKAYADAEKAGLSAQDKETEAIRQKYEVLLSNAKLSSKDIIELNNAQAREILASNAKFDAKRLENEAKFQAKLQELQEQSFLAGLSDEDLATEKTRQQFEGIRIETEAHYAELLTLADGNQAAITELAEWYSARRIEIDSDEAAAILKQNTEWAERRAKEELTRQNAKNRALAAAQRAHLKEMNELQHIFAQAISGEFQKVLFEGENIFEAIGDAFEKLISRMIAEAASKGLANIFAGLLGGGGGRKGGGIGNFLGGLLNLGRLFGGFKFADGGIVSGPTMGLVGEYPGAKSNPEVIAPLSDLTRILANTGGSSNNWEISGLVRGQDLLLMSRRAERTETRFYK